MITKNSTGANISNAMVSLIGGNARTFKARLIVNGSVLSCDILSISVSKGIGETFTPGTIFIPYMEATIANCTTSLEGEDITLQIGANISNADEWLIIGKFTVAEVKEALGEIKLTAVGFLNSKCGGDVTIAAGTSVANAITAINAVTGLSVTYSGVTISGTITTGYTKPAREWYGIIAGMFDGIVSEDNNGGIVIFKPLSGTSLTVSDERCVDAPEIAETNITEEGYTFRPGIMPMTLGDPRLEPWDYLRATIGGSTYTMPCQKITHDFDGGLQTTIDCSRTLPQAEIIKGPVEVKLDGVEVVADEALETAKDTNKYFWFTSTGSDAGAHITEIPQDTFISNPSGGNVLIDSNSVDIRDGSVVLSTFGANGAQVGQSGSGHVEILSSGMDIYGGDGTVSLAHIGYGYAKDESGSTTSRHPYFTFGQRTSGSVVGYDSMAEGLDVIAEGYCSHAEGSLTKSSGLASHSEGWANPGYSIIASGDGSHAEGLATYKNVLASADASHAEGSGSTASGFASHAEGNQTTASGANSHAEGQGSTASEVNSHAEGRHSTASGMGSHAEGYETTASGDYSHSSGYNTIAQGESQTVIGEYNVADTTSAFIIGNGVDNGSRSNALSIDWSGNVNIPRGGSYKSETSTAGSYVSLLGLNSSDNVQLGSSSYPLQVYGNGVYLPSTIIKAGYTLKFLCNGVNSETTGGWARALLNWYTDDNQTKLAHLGVYGGAGGSLSYMYIGNGEYNEANFRVYASGACAVPNTIPYYCLNASGTARDMMRINSSNTYVYGYGSYYNSEGGSLFEGYSVAIQSKGAVTITAPSGVSNSGKYTALYKITTMVVPVQNGAAGTVATAQYPIPSASQVSGYDCVGIVGITSASANVEVFNYHKDSNTQISAGFYRKVATSQAFNVTFYLLWLKATSA